MIWKGAIAGKETWYWLDKLRGGVPCGITSHKKMIKRN